MNSYISVDLETTGFSAETCDVIEIGAWKIKEGVVIDKFCTLVRPIMYIPRTVQDLTGITNEMVASSDTIESVLFEFFDFCEDLPFLGHNLPFDYRFLEYRGKFLGLDFSLNKARTGIDTLQLSKKLIPDLSSHKLTSVSEHLGVNAGNRETCEFHRAGFDSYVTKLVYDRFLYTYPSIFDVVTPKLLNIGDEKYGKVVNNDTLSFN